MEALDIGPNDLLLRKYRIEGVVGKGGTSVVFAARHEKLGTRVAIKVLNVSADTEEEATRRFLREARAAAALRSPHVARILDVDIDELGRRCQVMELLEGRDLSRVIVEESPLPIEQAVGYVSHVCAGMEEAHAAGILHRDLKPQNVFLTTAPIGGPLVKILDFGVSKILDSTLRVTASSTTQSGVLIGTPLYMSPERLKSPAEAEPRADIWAVGAILFELLTGKRPFVAATLPGLIAVLLSDDPAASVAVTRPEVPDALAKDHRVLSAKGRGPADAEHGPIARGFGSVDAGLGAGGARSPVATAGKRPSARPSSTAKGAIGRRAWAFGLGVLSVMAAVIVAVAVRSPEGASVPSPRSFASRTPERWTPAPRAPALSVEPRRGETSGASSAARPAVACLRASPRAEEGIDERGGSRGVASTDESRGSAGRERVIEAPRKLRGGAPSRARGRAGVFVRAALVVGGITAVSAGPARGSDAALAQTLFNEGRALMSVKRVPEACAKFAESQRLDPATGTLLNLAACHEGEGKLATAWAEYVQAQVAARRSNRPDRVQFAGEHIAALEKRLSYLTIHVPAAARMPGLEVRLDGTELGPAAWEMAAPIDPGRHRVTATVSGRSVFGRDVMFAQPGQRQIVDVVSLGRRVAVPKARHRSHQPPYRCWSGRRSRQPRRAQRGGTGAEPLLAIGGAGVALVAVGTVFGLRAYSEWKDRDKQCSDPTRACTPGLTSAWIANITLPLGAMGLGAASYRLWRGSW